MEDLRRLVAAIRSLGADLDLPVALRRLTEAAVELVDARYGALGVLSPDRTHLSAFITVGLSDEQEARNLVALRPHLEPAIAFAVEDVSRRVLDELEEADWRIIRLRRPADIAEAWAGIAAAARAGVFDASADDRPEQGVTDGR